jgi:Zn-dependent metalloprotease
MKGMKYIYIFVIVAISSCKTTGVLQDITVQENESIINRSFLDFSDSTLMESNVDLGEMLNLSKDFQFELNKKSESVTLDKYNKTHARYDIEYKGVKIDGNQLIVHSKEDGDVELVSGQYFNSLEMDCLPKIDEVKARKIALRHIDAEEYSWESDKKEWYAERNKNASSFPKGELIVYPKMLNKDTFSLFLAYKFWVLATQPRSETYVYVDAKSGAVINSESSEVSVNGTGDTKYSGTKTISTTQNGPIYVLRDYSRGLGIETLDLNQSTDEALAIDFIDNDNNWSSAEHRNVEMDDSSLDVHWGLGKAYDYFLQIHGRNGFDNMGEKVKGYVHYGVNWDDAGWLSYLRILKFGDGDGIINNPFTSLDIVAHEFGHGVSRSTANFSLYSEPGALMEGFSDIWGACVENYVDPNRDVWSIGNDIKISGGIPRRDMANPKAVLSPDTYGGQYWVTGNANHINSSILSHWFYLLSAGGAGINDNSDNYNVSGIGIGRAELIAYEAMVSLTQFSDFHDARDMTIQVAKNIYGSCSKELMSTLEAWYAVGVGPRSRTNLYLSNPIYNSSLTVHSAYEIDASNVLSPNTNVIYNAGKEVRLLPGFHGELNSKFHGYICPRL